MCQEKLRHYWELESNAQNASSANGGVASASDWPPLQLRLWHDVPAKPKGKGKSQKAAKFSSNPKDNLFGLIALHTGEFRHWAYQTVWWTEHPGPMPASGGIPPEFSIAAEPHKPWLPWRAEMEHINLPKRGSRPVAAPDFSQVENTLLAPATSGATHFRSMHLVLGLAELFVQYAMEATASEIYEAYLQNDIVVQKRTRQQRPHQPAHR